MTPPAPADSLRRARAPVLTIFALSGASALVYQVIWARQLSLVFGNTTASVSIVLAAFMLGLSLGAALAGRFLVGGANPLRLYALLEGGIGLYALAFTPLLHAVESLYPALFTDETAPAVLTLARALASFALLLVPTTLMGATLPLTTEYLHRLGVRPEDWNAGRLYAANTLGAALGAAASGFIGIELLGIQGTTRAAALFNFAVMGLGLWLARGLPSGRAAPVAAGAPAARGGRAILFVFACTGGLALAAEVLWTRALTRSLGSSTYAFSAILIFYLVGIALGSWLASGRVRRARAPERLVGIWILAAGFWHLLAIEILTLVMFQRPRLLGSAAGALLVVMPPALLGGALFPAVTRLVGGEQGDQGRPIARAYTWNTLGAIAGSLVGGFVIAPLFVQLHAIQALALGFAAVAALWIAIGVRGRAAPLLGVGVAGLALWATAGLRAEDRFARILEGKRAQGIVLFHESDAQAVTTVVRVPRDGPRGWALLVNGLGMTAKAFPTKAMAHLPMLLHPRPEDTLVICFGMGTSFRSALAHGGRVDVVELVPHVVDAFGFFHADAAEVLANPRGRVILNDGRNFLLLTRRRYDVITIDPPPPIDAAGVSHLHSREFLELVRDHLKPGGVATLWIPLVSAAYGLHDEDAWRGLVATFQAVFPYVLIFPGLSEGQQGGTHLVGSLAPITPDPARIASGLALPAVSRDLFEFSWDPYPAAAQWQRMPLPPRDERTRILTDDRPWLEFGLLQRTLAR